ncbi:MAG: hypothetical protein WCK10_02160 [Candidatus Staskawiczbacteria bacterium]
MFPAGARKRVGQSPPGFGQFARKGLSNMKEEGLKLLGEQLKLKQAYRQALGSRGTTKEEFLIVRETTEKLTSLFELELASNEAKWLSVKLMKLLGPEIAEQLKKMTSVELKQFMVKFPALKRAIEGIKRKKNVEVQISQAKEEIEEALKGEE